MKIPDFKSQIKTMAKWWAAVFLLFTIPYPLYPIPCLHASDAKRLVISFDLIEAKDAVWDKEEILTKIPVLMRRKNSTKFKYLGGGDFSLPPYTEETFLLRNDGSDIELILAWQPMTPDCNNVELRYRARMAYPGQQEFIRIEKSLRISSGKTSIIAQSDSEDGVRDTRPVWALVKIQARDSLYAFPFQGSIGVRLQIKEGYPYVTTVLPLTAASRAGLKEGDEIREINGYSTLQMTLENVGKLMRGDPGTEVVLKVRTASGKTEEKRVTRENR